MMPIVAVVRGYLFLFDFCVKIIEIETLDYSKLVYIWIAFFEL